jgi:cobalt-zinc-cadmium efflux system protein
VATIGTVTTPAATSDPGHGRPPQHDGAQGPAHPQAQAHPQAHGHGHDHAGGAMAGQRRPLAITLAITVVVMLLEAVGAWLSGSLALLADAGHMLTDAAALGTALVAAVLVSRPATATRTWGYQRAEILGAAVQSALLLAVGVYVLVEAVRRLIAPVPVGSTTMLAFGAVGLVGNGLGILLLARGREASLNVRAAFLDVVSDALASVAVLVAALVIALTDWSRADALVSLLVGGLILPRTWRLLREAVDVLMESAPKGVDLAAVRAHLLGVPHVLGVHDLHAFSVATALPVLTAHVVVDDACFSHGDLPAMLDRLQACLAGHFDVDHSTFQFEPARHAEHEHPTHS